MGKFILCCFGLWFYLYLCGAVGSRKRERDNRDFEARMKRNKDLANQQVAKEAKKWRFQ